MIDSVLESIKKPLNIAADDTTFDEEIVMHINSVFSTLYSIGASPQKPFYINGPGEKWSDFLGSIDQAQMVKSYMAIKVRLIFDPPATSFTIDAMSKMAAEWEWRLSLLEFDFDPESRPIFDDPRRELRQLNTRISEVEAQIEELDTEIEEVPDLSVHFNQKTGEA